MKNNLAEKKTLDFLLKKGWDFDEERETLNDISCAFRRDDKNALVIIIQKLSKRGWFFHSLKDITTLDEARKIHRNTRAYLYRKQYGRFNR